MRRIEVEGVPAALGAYSQAIMTKKLIFCSGQLGIDYRNNQFVTGDGDSGDVKAQTRQAILNLQNILHGCNSSLSGVLKTTIMLDDINDFGAVDQVYREFFLLPQNEPPPARTCFAVDKLPKFALVEIECIAAIIPEPAIPKPVSPIKVKEPTTVILSVPTAYFQNFTSNYLLNRTNFPSVCQSFTLLKISGLYVEWVENQSYTVITVKCVDTTNDNKETNCKVKFKSKVGFKKTRLEAVQIDKEIKISPTDIPNIVEYIESNFQPLNEPMLLCQLDAESENFTWNFDIKDNIVYFFNGTQSNLIQEKVMITKPKLNIMGDFFKNFSQIKNNLYVSPEFCLYTITDNHRYDIPVPCVHMLLFKNDDIKYETDSVQINSELDLI